MHPRLLSLYNQELSYVREMGAEFARQFPKIAGRLGMDSIEVADPYIERLLEGFAFLTARVHLKLEAEFPRFVQQLLEVAYPNMIAPIPSMAIAYLPPDPLDPNLAKGHLVERGAAMRSIKSPSMPTQCQFRTAHEVMLWPIELAQVQYFSYAPDLPLAQVREAAAARGGLKLKVRAFDGIDLRTLPIESLRFFISAPDDAAFRLYELLFGSATGVLTLPSQRPATWWKLATPASIRSVGFDDDEALLPVPRSGFRGHRLLQEFAALPQRLLFFDITDLADAVKRSDGREFEIVILFNRGDAQLESLIDIDSVNLHCAPVINLFEKRVDRIVTDRPAHEYHVVADRTRPVDFEVFRIDRITGHRTRGDEERFYPLYTSFHDESQDHGAFFTVRREPRLLAQGVRREDMRSSYRGSEVFVSLVGRDEAIYDDDVRQLGIDALCTNRDLPTLMAPGGIEPRLRRDFTLDLGAPITRAQCLRGPSRPQAAHDDGKSTWSMIGQLNLNLLSLIDLDDQEGAATLRQMLMLYGHQNDASWRKLIDGIRTVTAKRSVRRLAYDGPLTFATGVEITITVDELSFQGISAFLFSSVLERLFARNAAINSFTQTRLASLQRGEIMRWPPRSGTRPLS
ncbi:type VI secretion system baseplate subunit TssF [soil metagenome]